MLESEKAFRKLYAEVRDYKTAAELDAAVMVKMMDFQNWEAYDKRTLRISIGIHSLPVMSANDSSLNAWKELALMDPSLDNYPFSIIKAFIVYVADERLVTTCKFDDPSEFANRVDFTEYLKIMRDDYSKV